MRVRATMVAVSSGPTGFDHAPDPMAVVTEGTFSPNGAWVETFGAARPPFVDALASASELPTLVEHDGRTWDARGRRVGGELVLCLRDVTADRAAKGALAASEAQFRRLVERSRDVISRIGVDGRRIYATPSIRDHLGFDPDEIVGTTPFDFFHPDDVAPLREVMRGLLTNGEEQTVTYRNRHRDGRFVWTETICVPIKDPATGAVVEIHANSRDVSERVAAEDALRAAKDRYQVLADTSIDMISCHDEAGVYLYASPASQALVGLAPEALVGRSAFEFIHVDDRAALQQALARVLSDEAPLLTTYRIRRADGSLVAVQSIAQRRPTAGGVEIQVATRDVTPLREAEQRLRELHTFTQAVLSTVRALVVVLDRRGRIAMFNRACEELTGYPADEVRDREFFDLFIPAEQRAGVREVFANLSAGMFPSQYGNDWLTRGGERRWIEWVNSCILDDAGEVSFVVGTGVDRTQQRAAEAERSRAEQQLRERNVTLEGRVAERTAALEAINRELETFSYSVSHDLRAPLRAIAGFGQLLLEEQGERLDEEGRGFLDRIIEAARRMSTLIDDLLELSRSTRASISRVEVDLTSMAHDVVDLLRRAHPDRRVEVVVEPGLSAAADAALARTVLENLLGNAWKYTSRTPDARIVLRALGPLAFVVEDNGAGFDMAYADKLFGPFQRLHHTTEFEGNGIGLATVLRIVTRHGGWARAFGEVGRGARFSFSFSQEPPALERG